MKPFFKRFAAIAAILMLTGAGCSGPITASQKASQPITIDVWGVVDDVDAYAPVFADYRVLHPNVTFNYRRLRLEEYEQDLLEGFADDRGPDIFLIHNDWTGKYLSKIAPMPLTTTVADSEVVGTLSKKQTWISQTNPTISLKDYKSDFADVVLNDTIRDVNVSTDPSTQNIQTRIVGVPVDVDTLALFYNKDLLDAAGIPNPPDNWVDFQDQVKKLVQLDSQNNIVQAAVGMGTSQNVENSTDILTALMIQDGAEMTSPDGTPTFQTIPASLASDRSEPPSYAALTFYTDFANPTKETYTWNASQPDSLQSFMDGHSAYFFGYAYQLPTIEAQAPGIDLGIAKLPQITGNPEKDYANYWYWTVAKKSKNQNVDWDFLNFLIQPQEMTKVLDIVKRPSARKSLLTGQLEDESVGVFASQVLTATSWYQGDDPQAVTDAFGALIDSVSAGTAIPNAMGIAADKISQTYNISPDPSSN